MSNYKTPIPVSVIGTITAASVTVSALAVGAAVNVPANTVTTITTYTASQDRAITQITISGTDYAKFELVKNTVLIATKRSSPERSIDFLFISPLSISSGDILEIKVTHYAPGVLADFESTIFGA